MRPYKPDLDPSQRGVKSSVNGAKPPERNYVLWIGQITCIPTQGDEFAAKRRAAGHFECNLGRSVVKEQLALIG